MSFSWIYQSLAFCHISFSSITVYFMNILEEADIILHSKILEHASPMNKTISK